eukprot:Nk52_evm1s696 gene=Nk52_evmTU1s696
MTLTHSTGEFPSPVGKNKTKEPDPPFLTRRQSSGLVRYNPVEPCNEMIQQCSRYFVEQQHQRNYLGGTTSSNMGDDKLESNHLQQWYRNYFQAQPHCNYVGRDARGWPFVLSVRDYFNGGPAGTTMTMLLSSEVGIRAILWAIDGKKQIALTRKQCGGGTKVKGDNNGRHKSKDNVQDDLDNSFNSGGKLKPQKLLEQLLESTGGNGSAGFSGVGDRKERKTSLGMASLFGEESSGQLQEFHDDDLEEKLVAMESLEHCTEFKVGVVFAQKDQTSDDDFFANENGSAEFNTFLDLIATKIRLKGFSQFRGGLDVKSDTTGEYSYFTEFKENSIMFHVSTLLPFTNGQQLERKRHIGNDIVVVIFQEEDSSPYDLKSIRSQYNHVFIVVRYIKALNVYCVACACKADVAAFGPAVPMPNHFAPEELRDFLLTKIIKGERAAYSAPVFCDKLNRTREQMLNNIGKQEEASRRKESVSRRLSRRLSIMGKAAAKAVGIKSNIKKNLKSRSSLFHLRNLIDSLDNPVTSAAVVGDNYILAINHNIFTLQDDLFIKLIACDGNVVQLDVIEHLGIMIFTVHNEMVGSRLFKCTLDVVESKSTLQCDSFLWDIVGNIDYYCIGSFLNDTCKMNFKICVVYRERIWLISWPYKEEEFLKLSVLNEKPTIVSLSVPVRPSSCCFIEENHRLVSIVQNVFHIIDFASGTSSEITQTDSKDAILQCTILSKQETLFTHNTLSIVRDGSGLPSPMSTEIHWDTIPSKIVSYQEYVIGVFRSHIEVRSRENGGLIQVLKSSLFQYLCNAKQGVIISARNRDDSKTFSAELLHCGATSHESLDIDPNEELFGSSDSLGSGKYGQQLGTPSSESDPRGAKKSKRLSVLGGFRRKKS